MLIQEKNPYTELLHKAIRDDDKDEIIKQEKLSRDFISNKLEELKNVVLQKTTILTSYEKDISIKNDRKVIKQIYNDSILLNRELRDLVVRSVELKSFCREFLNRK